MDDIPQDQQVISSEGGELTPEDRAAFFRAAFKKPDEVDRRGEKYLKAAEAAAEKAGG